MSVAARDLVREEQVPLAARLAHGPAEGWSSVALLAIMLLALGVAIDDARWAGQTTWSASETAFIMPALLLGGLAGFLAAKSRLHWLAAQAAGALVGGLFLVVAVAGVVSNDPSLSVRLDTLLVSVVLFARDLFVLGIRSSQTSVFLLVLGGAGWALGQFSAFVTYRRGRPLNAVAASGLFFFVELSVTAKDQYRFLIVYAAAALLFLVRMNLVEQRTAWLRRRIGDSGAVSALYMRGGVTFVAVALGGALALTATASSAPLYGWWRGLDAGLVDWGQQVSQLFGGVQGPNRFPPDLFTSTATLTGVWQSSTQSVFTYDPGQAGGQYWMGATYTTFDGRSWHQDERTGSPVVPAGDLLLGKTRDYVSPATGLDQLKITVTDQGLDSAAVLSPEMPVSVNRAATVYTNGPGGPYAGASFVDPPGPNETYTIDALVRAPTQAQGGLTAQQLAGASQTYPAWLRPFVQYKGAVGSVTIDTANQIVASLPASQRDAYHIAVAIQDYLYASGGFTYNTDVASLCPTNDLVDCFLTTKQGYCEYFATAMTMMLRTQGIPARYVRGYLPGELLSNGSYEVTAAAAHAWVEVYFPGYGWVRFDPTPGNSQNGQRPSVFPTGVSASGPGGSQGPGISPGRRTFASGGATATPGPTGVGAGSVTGTGAGPAAPLAIGAMLLLLVIALLMTVLSRWQRGPAVAEPEAVYRGVARLAGRFGYGPRPTQTAYEYAGSLGDVLPAVRPELQLVARAKVETSYARRPPRGPAMAALRAAYGRLRLRLLSLAFRRRRPTGRSMGRRQRR
jgi:transglutaminase-like putative cysteine protease